MTSLQKREIQAPLIMTDTQFLGNKGKDLKYRQIRIICEIIVYEVFRSCYIVNWYI